MKKITTLIILFAFSTLFAQNSNKQTNTVQRKVILENFTTAQCPNCPPIHVLLENYTASHPNAILIAQHAGYGTDAMTIPENTQLLAMYNAGGSTYAPALAIDRFKYASGLTGGAADPGPVFWPGESQSATISRINDRLAMPSNISMTIDWTVTGSTLDLDIQGSLLENVSGSDLRLVVYIIEDGLIYYQSGGGSNYTHNNVMRDAISGTWGDAGVITSNTSGTTFAKTYSYEMNASWVLNNLSVVAFVANYDNGNVNNREVLQAEKVSLLQPIGTNNIAVLEANVPDACGNLTSIFKVNNVGADEITSLSINYSINGGAETGNILWEGTLPFNEINELLLDIEITDILSANTIDFNVIEVNGVTDDDTTNNTTSTTFAEAPEEEDDYLKVTIQTDANGSQTSWVLNDSNGDTVASGDSYGNNQTYHQELSLTGDCYTFILTDTGGDGGGKYILKGTSGTIYYSLGNDYNSVVVKDVKVKNTASINDTAFANSLIYPNPANTVLNIENATGLNLNLYDVLGRLLYSKDSILKIETINIETVKEGTYFLKLSDGHKVRTEKIIIVK
ncbi:MAG TPA: Omp28-related outer membrane protein [Lutibacter sp.]|nr:Omp28-related outer membrane protein [Lutibacter sp.]